MNKNQLKGALAKLGVSPNDFKDLEVPQLQALLTQKQIEKAQLDAENKISQDSGAGDGADDGGSDEGGGNGDNQNDGQGDGDGQGGSEGGDTNAGGDTSAGAGALSSSAKEPAVDGDSDGYDGLVKMRSRGFKCNSLGLVVSQGVPYSTGKEFKAKDGDEFWADEKTCEHLLGYRVAEKA
jgi:hypothetical protein